MTREDWLDAGLALLASDGRWALTLERLCARLARTKGSFYHHFADMQGYQRELLARWRDRHTEAMIEDSRTAGDPRARGERLREQVAAADLRVERAIRAWAEVEPDARAALDEVDARRLAYLTELARSRVADPARALVVARLEYAAFVGTVTLFHGLPRAQRELLSRSLDEALTLWATATPAS
jgi:AcrR family transcriptional regulator